MHYHQKHFYHLLNHHDHQQTNPQDAPTSRDQVRIRRLASLGGHPCHRSQQGRQQKHHHPQFPSDSSSSMIIVAL